MYALGIESTAHTFGCGIVSFDGKILANEKAVFTTKTGGMIPAAVARHHERVKDGIVRAALEKAGLKLEELGLISYSHGPGFAPCLLVGLAKAKGLAKQAGLPLVGVNHCIAHLTIGDLVCGTTDPVYLYVSGVNTQVISLAGRRFRIFGETLDIGLGNALDKFGREAGLGFPAGPSIERLARKGRYVELPYAVKGMDVSFAGMITHATRLVKEGKAKIEDVCYSLQETAFAMLAEVAERAMACTGKSELLLIGGVAANKRLCEMLATMCKEREARFFAVPLELSGDQGAMIAWQGILQFKAGDRVEPGQADIFPYERTDQVEVIWRESPLSEKP